MHLDIDEPLDLRVAEFRSDPEKMKCVNAFVDDLVEKAQKEAEIRRNNISKQKHKLVRILIVLRFNLFQLIAFY